ncbi:MAG TPA: aspartate kinase [Cytophagales bacterium]|nr:aspartate kinase [Cytophagales bacterium]
MKIMKFGGTSVGSPERIRGVARLVLDNPGQTLVVLSAKSGTTNALVAIGDLLQRRELSEARKQIRALHNEYVAFIKDLLPENPYQAEGLQIVERHFGWMENQAAWHPADDTHLKELLAQGELMSTQFFCLYLKQMGEQAVLLPALDFMRINEDEEPDIPYIQEKLTSLLEEHPGQTLFVTQGYIALNPLGRVDNLKRGGSDYTASLIGAALKAEETQIWTDIDGMHNNDPRFVEPTFPIAQLSFDEAAELAYFGAKILHPASILPAQKYNIPVRLKNTMDPGASGTLISDQSSGQGLKAIAAKDGITVIKIKSTRMLLAYGFLRKVFEIFEKFSTPIDMITTSEVAVSLTIDDASRLVAITEELRGYGTVEVEQDQTIVCMVGDRIAEDQQTVGRVFRSLEAIPLRMICYGGSRHNISVLVSAEHKVPTLRQLNQGLFELHAAT